MPTAKKLPSGSWRCLVYDHTEEIIQADGSVKKKRIYRSFTDDDPSPKGKRRAERAASEWAANKETASRCDLTVGEAMDKYIEARSSVLSPGTIREYKRSRKVDLQELMNIRVDKLTQEQVQLAVNREALSHSPKSVRNMHGLLSAVLSAYRPDFALNTALPKKIKPKLHIPSESDIQALIEAVTGTDMEIPVLLAAFGPMRRGEIAALDREHIRGNIVHVEYAMALDEHNKWVKKSPKSAAGNRYIEFPQFVIDRIPNVPGNVVHIDPAQISNRFRRIVSRLGLERFRFHDLRHYCASIQHALGIPDAYIMQRGGWESDMVLKSVYRHVLEDEAEKMNALANDHFSDLCNTKCNTK